MDVAFYGRKPGYYINQYPRLKSLIRDDTVRSGAESQTPIPDTSPPPKSNTNLSSQSKENTQMSGPPKDDTLVSKKSDLSGPIKKSDTQISGTPISLDKDDTKLSGPTKSPTQLSGPPKSPTQISGPPKSPTQLSGPPKSPTQISGPPKSPTQLSGPSKSVAEDNEVLKKQDTEMSGPVKSDTKLSSDENSPSSDEREEDQGGDTCKIEHLLHCNISVLSVEIFFSPPTKIKTKSILEISYF